MREGVYLLLESSTRMSRSYLWIPSVLQLYTQTYQIDWNVTEINHIIRFDLVKVAVCKETSMRRDCFFRVTTICLQTGKIHSNVWPEWLWSWYLNIGICVFHAHFGSFVTLSIARSKQMLHTHLQQDHRLKYQDDDISIRLPRSFRIVHNKSNTKVRGVIDTVGIHPRESDCNEIFVRDLSSWCRYHFVQCHCSRSELRTLSKCIDWRYGTENDYATQFIALKTLDLRL
jgi:hypothetical protein